MKSPALAQQRVSAEIAQPSRAELEAFVAMSKRQRPFAWSRVERLQEACRRESLAVAAVLNQARRVTAEPSFA